MAPRPCLDCGTPCSASRCPACRSGRERAHDQARGNSAQRGYDRAHRAQRAAWEPDVAAGRASCWRCGRPILPGQPWHLGHDDHDRSITRGPEHVDCNLAAAGRATARR